MCLCFTVFYCETQTGERDATWVGMDQKAMTGSQKLSYHVTNQPASVSYIIKKKSNNSVRMCGRQLQSSVNINPVSVCREHGMLL